MKAILTIDDAPSESFESKLQILATHNIQAIFFCLGSLLTSNRDSLVGALKAGHVLGNHSYDHPSFSNCDLKQCLEQIDLTDEVLQQIYSAASQPMEVKYLRFPYGDKGDFNYGNWFKGNTLGRHLWTQILHKKMTLMQRGVFPGQAGRKRHLVLQNHLEQQGFTEPPICTQLRRVQKARFHADRDWCWSLDTEDWRLQKEGLLALPKIFRKIENVISRTEDADSGQHQTQHIVLMHDHGGKIEGFERILNKMLEAGLEFIPPQSMR